MSFIPSSSHLSGFNPDDIRIILVCLPLSGMRHPDVIRMYPDETSGFNPDVLIILALSGIHPGLIRIICRYPIHPDFIWILSG